MGIASGLLAKMGFKPRNGAADAYPYDLDGSLRFVRPKTGIDFYPSHSNADNFQKLGAVSGLMPQQDIRIWSQGFGKMPSGPIVSALPENLQWQITVPGLTKQLPQY